ncbi:MAG: tRNA guanosine(34) transglycosylase Tgt [Planctomycetes bacterium]|nr:tRNA guanosine(34) transglycosylase Tgt [Planctomycetota bacterium]
MFDFHIHHRDGGAAARAGEFTTPHGTFSTPAFMPVGTRASVKGILPRDLRELGSEILLANTYHLALRPGAEVVRRLGGVQAMMGWDGPVLTDSGGFQVFSLANLRTVDDDGVEFRSHIDGASLRMTPESCIALQADIGADIIMALDQCPPYPAARDEVEQATERTLLWARRCRDAHRTSDRQALFPIVQGGEFDDLRRDCARQLVAEVPSPGYAIGGVSVGEPHDVMMRAVEAATSQLPSDRPRYLMGVGQPRDVLGAIRRGVDMFDCVLPTRNGRNASAFTFSGTVRLRNQQHEDDCGPIEAGCDCPACRQFSRGAIRHFFQVGEMLGPILTSLHNLRFFSRFLAQVREAIRAGRLAEYEKEFLKSVDS